MSGSWIPEMPEPEFDKDLGELTATDLLTAAQALRNAIRKHRDERGHDRCWLDDQELYKILPEGALGDSTLPPKEEFIANCHRYWEHRQDPSIAFLRQKDVDNNGK